MWYNRLMNRDLVKILGFNVDTFSFDEAVEYAFNHHGQVVTINPEMISAAHSNSEFANIIDNADLIVPDGIGVELGLKILGHNVHRIAGIELGKELIIKFSKAGKKIAMVGAKPTIVDGAIENLKNEIPDVIVNVVVASNLERNLYLTTELIDMDYRMVIALNMFDELEQSGGKIDYKHLGNMIGVPIVPTVSRSGKGKSTIRYHYRGI